MNDRLNETHHVNAQSWIESANSPGTDFPIQNLPFGIYVHAGLGHVGVAIGDRVLDVTGCNEEGLFSGPAEIAAVECEGESLNAFMALGHSYWAALRKRIFELLGADASADTRARVTRHLMPMSEVELAVPARIGDYTDFYASVFHATNVGSMFRPDNPLLPNYKYVPIAYHGRASSIVISGTSVRRPNGQTKETNAAVPQFGPSRRLDYEAEVGVFIGPGNELGSPISIGEADEHIFGLCLVNDWSARDLQTWEYQPLGPFLAKNFSTSISPWIVTREALAPFRTAAFERPQGDPSCMAYLDCEEDRQRGGLDVAVEVWLASEQMRRQNIAPVRLSRGTLRDMYWTVAQMIAHHSSNGCDLQPGDMLATGTVSGRVKDSRGCLLELAWRGTEPVQLPTGEQRSFLEDGDEVILRGYCEREGFRRVGFGECCGTILPAKK